MSKNSFFAVLIVLALINAIYADEETIELPHKAGYVYVKPQDIQKGCARFYISDPITEVEGTKYWQVCSAPSRDKEAKVAIGSGVFAKIKDKYGMESANSISFISTGPQCWVFNLILPFFSPSLEIPLSHLFFPTPPTSPLHIHKYTLLFF